MDVFIVAHLICAAAFAALAFLVAFRRQTSRIGNYFLAACVATVAWAVAAASIEFLPQGVAFIAESVRSAAWLFFLSALLVPGEERMMAQWRRRASAAAVPLLSALTIGNDLLHYMLDPQLDALSQFQFILRIGVAVLAISLIENFYRNTGAARRWNIIPLCIAIGSLFAFELFLYSDALLFRRVDQSLMAARAIVAVFGVPLLALALARNDNWRVDIRVSRAAVFHVATFVMAGILLVAVAAVGTLFRHYGGEWALVLQVTSLCGSVILLATVLSSESARSRMRHLVLQNFFSYRYDYRVEWIRFIEALSSSDATTDLRERVIAAVARIVNSPGGALFQRRDGVYVPSALWNARVATDAKETPGSEFIAAFRGGRWIQQLGAAEGRASVYGQEGFWLAVPLPHHEDLIGFVLLLEPRAPFALDWEVYDLLRTVARQAASYLSEEDAAHALADANMLQEYSKRFAFVVHDIKNLSSQLGLVVSNARRHGSNPDFQADALRTIENSVSRMAKLLSQLQAATAAPLPEAAAAPADAAADVVAILREVVSVHASRERIETRFPSGGATAGIDGDRLRSALTHIVNNAVEASGPEGRVDIGLKAEDDRVIVEVADQGPGMEMSFVRDKLFRPFRTTKDGGYGIGAFQARELIRAVGGRLEVASKPGSGTTMRVILPKADAAVAQVFPAA